MNDSPRPAPARARRRFRTAMLLLLALGAAALVADALYDTFRLPVVRRATIAMPYMAPGAAPVRVIFASDLHVVGPEMPPARLARIVAQITALDPDLVLLGGDFISERLLATRRYTPREAVAPLAGLRPRFGVAAVLGNHDEGPVPRGEPDVAEALTRLGIRVVANDVVRMGPVTVVGIGDGKDQGKTWRAIHMGLLAEKLASGGGPPFIGLAHMSFDAAELPDPVRLLLAGHTHCGQIALPGTAYWGAVAGVTHCGINRVGGRLLVMTAGLGQSGVPLRIGVPPDIWLLTLVPKQTCPAA